MSNNHDATKQRPPITTTDAGIPAPCDECSLTAGPGRRLAADGLRLVP
jgi:hypothetical protein